MTFRKVGIALLAVALIAGSTSSSRASAQPEVFVGAAANTAGAWAVGGFVGVVAAICVYDLVLKYNGVKNWDGTPKKAGKH